MEITTIMLRDELCGAFDVIDWCAAVAPPGGGEASPPMGGRPKIM